MNANPPDPSPRPPSIFISYRRAETEGHAGRLSDSLREHFGERAHVFMDFDAIPVGEDFVKVISEAVGSCHALIAVIGRQWLTITDARTGKRRLDNEKDHVRAEIASALKRGVRVIPVLVQDAAMPAEDELPDDLKPLATRNALELSGARWNYDVQTLIRALESTLPKFSAPGRRGGLAKVTAGRVLGGAVAAATILALVWWLAWGGRGPSEGPAVTGRETPDPGATATASPTPTPTPPPTPGGSPVRPGGREDTDLMTLSSVFTQAGPAVVRITAAAQGGQKFTGSGFYVTREGHILTAGYIASPGDERGMTYTVRLGDGTERPASLLTTDSALDLAILKAEPIGFNPIPLAEAAPAPGARVVAIGAIGGGAVMPVFGTVRDTEDRFVGIEYDTGGGAGGIGGGPVLDSRGRAVGVSHSAAPPRRLCVRSDLARRFLMSKGVRL